MSAQSDIVIDEFLKLCQWTYESWRTHRVLFDPSTRTDKLSYTSSVMALTRISIITQEYFLQQLAKLHDPAAAGNQKNLGLEYIIMFGGWDAPTKAQLEAMKDKLDGLHLKIRPARNKILSHNDLKTILKKKTLGAFPPEADTTYFRILEEFANLIREKGAGKKFHFQTSVDSETNLLADALAQ